MNKKSFFLGFVVGIILTVIGLVIAGLIMQNSSNNDPIKYLEQPVSYENKQETSFEVLQVIGNSALAKEASDKIGDDVFYGGNTVLVIGENFYSEQIIIVKNPVRIGTYSYTNNGGMPMTVPVINGELR